MGSTELGFVKDLIAGGIAGAVSRTAVSPLERLKIIYQLQSPSSTYQFDSLTGTLKKIYKTEGLRGLMKGNFTNVVRIVPYSAVQFASYEYYKTVLSSDPAALSTKERLLAGSLAGITSVIATYPLDLVRTRLSAYASEQPESIFSLTRHIYKNEGGILALYSGLVPTILGIAPYVALNFTIYEKTKLCMLDFKRGKQTRLVGSTDDPVPSLSVVERLTAGGFAGAMAQTITYPFDVLRRRMQILGMKDSNLAYKNTWDAVVTMFKQEGIKGFYKGMIPNYLKVVPTIAISFVTYESTKSLLNSL